MLNQITVPTVNTSNITPLDNKPEIGAEALKVLFDKGSGDVLSALVTAIGEINAVITALVGTGSAADLGASAVYTGDQSAANIQAKLAMLKTYMDNMQLTAGAGDMAKSVYDTDNDGIVDNAEKIGGKSLTDLLLTSDKGVSVASLTSGKLPAAQLTDHTHNIDALGKVWRGTQAQWDALTTKSTYWLALIVG